MIFSKLFKIRPTFSKEVQALYKALVLQSRDEAFFTTWEVADTVEGRFDMIILHAFVVMRRLKEGKEQTDAFSQSLYDLMFADMDLNLRELGVGDMGLARRVPKMAEAFYGRIKAYEEGLQADDENMILKSALDRNLYRKTPTSDTSLAEMALYLRHLIVHFDTQSLEDLQNGQITFPKVPKS